MPAPEENREHNWRTNRDLELVDELVNLHLRGRPIQIQRLMVDLTRYAYVLRKQGLVEVADTLVAIRDGTYLT